MARHSLVMMQLNSFQGPHSFPATMKVHAPYCTVQDGGGEGSTLAVALRMNKLGSQAFRRWFEVGCEGQANAINTC